MNSNHIHSDEYCFSSSRFLPSATTPFLLGFGSMWRFISGFISGLVSRFPHHYLFARELWVEIAPLVGGAGWGFFRCFSRGVIFLGFPFLPFSFLFSFLFMGTHEVFSIVLFRDGVFSLGRFYCTGLPRCGKRRAPPCVVFLVFPMR